MTNQPAQPPPVADAGSGALWDRVFRHDDFLDHISALERRLAKLTNENLKLHADAERYRNVQGDWDWFFENSLEMLFVAGNDGYLKKVNAAVVKTMGYSREEILLKPYTDFVHPDDVKGTRAALKSIRAGAGAHDFENRYRHKNGTWRWLSWSCPALSPRSTDLYAIARDVTSLKSNEEETSFRAEHDWLTGLGNRAAFDKSLAQALGRAQRNPVLEVGLMILDLDGFKAVNDTHGHPTGDLVLRNVAARLRLALRTIDGICRLGGDEFAVVVEGPAPLKLEAVARKIVAAVTKPVTLETATLAVGCSCGISTYPAPAENAESLYAQADAAMYAVKRAGKRSFGRFAACMASSRGLSPPPGYRIQRE